VPTRKHPPRPSKQHDDGHQRRAAPGAQVGISLNLAHAYPASETPEDEAATWHVDGEGNRWFLDPIFRGSYPADLLDRNELVTPLVEEGDLQTIAAPIDFLGVNYYFRFVVSGGTDGPQMERIPNAQETDMGWEVYPDGLYQLLMRVSRDYAPPAIYVTENGAAFGDVRVHDGRVHDPAAQCWHRRRRHHAARLRHRSLAKRDYVPA